MYFKYCIRRAREVFELSFKEEEKGKRNNKNKEIKEKYKTKNDRKKWKAE